MRYEYEVRRKEPGYWVILRRMPGGGWVAYAHTDNEPDALDIVAALIQVQDED